MNGTLYDLYTERVNIPLLEATVSGYFDGYSLVWATGVWRGLREQAVIVRIVTEGTIADRAKVYDLAESIRVALKQTAVLVTEQPIASVLITAPEVSA